MNSVQLRQLVFHISTNRPVKESWGVMNGSSESVGLVTCIKCHTPRKMGDLVNGICIFCEPELIVEKTHEECQHCGEMKREFVEVDVGTSFNFQTGLVEMCTDCEQDFNDDPKGFFWRDPD